MFDIVKAMLNKNVARVTVPTETAKPCVCIGCRHPNHAYIHRDNKTGAFTAINIPHDEDSVKIERALLGYRYGV